MRKAFVKLNSRKCIFLKVQPNSFLFLGFYRNKVKGASLKVQTDVKMKSSSPTELMYTQQLMIRAFCSLSVPKIIKLKLLTCLHVILNAANPPWSNLQIPQFHSKEYLNLGHRRGFLLL